MIYTPTRSELSEFGILLNLPTIPPKSFLSALIDVYADFCDVQYEDIIQDIKAEYLTYQDSTFIRKVITGDNTLKPKEHEFGYLWYNDGENEVCVAIN